MRLAFVTVIVLYVSRAAQYALPSLLWCVPRPCPCCKCMPQRRRPLGRPEPVDNSGVFLPRVSVDEEDPSQPVLHTPLGCFLFSVMPWPRNKGLWCFGVEAQSKPVVSSNAADNNFLKITWKFLGRIGSDRPGFKIL